MSDDSLSVTISGRDVNLKRLLTELRRDLVATDQAGTRTGRGVGDGLAQGTAQGQAGVLRLQSAMARFEAQTGQTDAAIRRLKTSLSVIGQSTPQTIAMHGQLARLEEQAAKAASTIPKTTSALHQLAGAAGPLAAAFAVDTLRQYGQEAILLANRTKDAKSALETLAGSPRLYAEALQAATTQQRLFGGSLADNIQGIQGLITVARSSGAELTQLIDLSQRLSIKDPTQGIAGARTALNEALEGDPSSLARRYEIPKAALAALRDESISTQQKLAILDQYLNQIGITSESVAGSISRETQAMNALAASAEAVQLKVGAMLSQALTPAAEGATALMQSLATGEQANATLTALVVTLQELSGATSSSSAENVTFVSSLLSAIGVLTPAQQATAELDAQLNALAQQFATGAITAAEYNAQSAALVTEQARVTDATQTLDAAQNQLTATTQTTSQAMIDAAHHLAAEAEQKAASAAQGDALAAVQATLAGLGGSVAAGLMTSAQAAATLAAQYQITEDAAYRLVAAQAAVAAGQARLAAQAKQTRDLTQGGAGYNAPGRRGNTDADIARVATLQQEARAQQAVARTTATATAARRAATSARPVSRGGGGGGGSSAPRVTEAQQTAQRLAEIERDSATQRQNIEQDHQETMADIAADGAQKRAAAEAQLHSTRLRGRADFYRRLADMDQAQAQRMSAAYEQIEQETSAIAAEQGADVAAAYREAALKAAEAQITLQQEIAQARKDGDEGKAHYLEGVAALQAAADADELARIRSQGSALAAESARRYADEERRYAEHLDRMQATYNEKVGKATAATLPPPSRVPPPPSPPLPSTTATATGDGATRTNAAPVQDAAASQAVKSSQEAITDGLHAVREAVDAVQTAVQHVESAIRSLKTTRPFAS